MKITIEIPKEFEEHFEKDCFSESLRRLGADAHCLAGNYEKELCIMLENAFNNGVVRCKDCKYVSEFVDGLMLCHRTRESFRVEPNTICGKGVKRND